MTSIEALARTGRGILWPTAMLLGWLGIARAAETPSSPPSAEYSESLKLVSDASVKESLGRQKNLNFGGVRIDGEKSDASLSALTADQIADAVATRVPTPNLDADTIGGELQLTSRRAYDQKEQTLRANAALSYDPLIGKHVPDASITFGRSFGKLRQFGYLATFEHDQGRDADQDVRLDWSPRTTQLSRFDVSQLRQAYATTNFNGMFDWKLGDNSFVFVRADTKFRTQRDRGRSLGYDLPGLADSTPENEILLPEATLRRSVEETRERNRMHALSAGANHARDPWLIELRLTHRAARDRVTDRRTYDFAEVNLPVLYQRPAPEFPKITAPAGGLPGDLALQTLDELQIHRGDDRVSDDVASADFTRTPGEKAGTVRLKFGGKARLQRTTRDVSHDVYEGAGTGLRVGDVRESGDDEVVLSGRYRLQGFPSLDALRHVFETEPGRFALNESKTRGDTDPARFDVRQRILAAYAMATSPIGKTRLVVGARVEHTASEFGGYEVTFDEEARYESTRALAARSDFTNFFPGIHASRELSGKVTLYVAWTRSIRRPEYTDIVPARRISRFERTIDEGNANLEPALYTNYDVAVDYAYRDDGRVSLEMFHREIGNPTLTRRTELLEGPFAGYERTRPENGGSARIQGAQLTCRQEFSAFADRLTGLAIEINYTHQRSRQSLEDRPGEDLVLTALPTHELAVTLSYDHGPYYLSLDMTRLSRSVASLGSDPGEDVFVRDLTNWDATLSREFPRGIRVFLEIQNLNAVPDRTYAGDPSRPKWYGRDSREYRVGVKWAM